MSWLRTLAVALLAAVVGCVGAGVLANVCVDWYRITSREGASGYFVVAMGLIGLAAGLVIGIVCARIVASGANPGFARELGLALGVVIGLLAVGAGLAWLGADLPPKLDGRALVVETEVRLPANASSPDEKAATGTGWFVTITADHGQRSQTGGSLRVRDAAQRAGRWVLPATMSLSTSDSGKTLGVKLADGETQFFHMPLPSQPSQGDMTWSPWLSDAHFGDQRAVPGPDAVAVRYRVQYWVEPAPSPPSPAELEARAASKETAAFDALTPASPLEAWLRFTHYSKPQDRREAAAAAIIQRPDVVATLSALIRSQDREAADLALRAVALMKPPPAGLAAAVEDVGREICLEIRVVNSTTTEADPSYQRAADVSVRFAGWTEAARVLHGRPGVNLLPVMREILELARVRGESSEMRDVVRVSSYYVKEWGGIVPAQPNVR